MKHYEFTIIYVRWDGRIMPHSDPGDIVSDWQTLYAEGWHNPNAIGQEQGYTKFLLEREVQDQPYTETPP